MRAHCLFLFLLLPGFLFSQVVSPGTDSVSGPPKKEIKVNVIDPLGKRKVVYKGDPLLLDSVQKAIKICPTQFLRGEFAGYFEWRLSRHYSVEGGLGITYIDYIYESSINNFRFILNGLEKDNARFYSGFSARVIGKIYPSRYDNAITGWYFGPAYAYRTWRMDYLISNGLVAVPYDVDRVWHELTIQVGEQDPDALDLVFTEWYFNAGIRIREESRVRGSGLGAEIISRRVVQPLLTVGIKIGFAI